MGEGTKKKNSSGDETKVKYDPMELMQGHIGMLSARGYAAIDPNDPGYSKDEKGKQARAADIYAYHKEFGEMPALPKNKSSLADKVYPSNSKSRMKD